MLLPQLSKTNKKQKTSTQQVGDILRHAAVSAKAQERAPALPLMSQLPSALTPGAPPAAPVYGQPPTLQFRPSYGLDPELEKYFPGYGQGDGISALDLQNQARLMRGQAPGAADFNLANEQAKTAEAAATLKALYPNGFEATEQKQLELPQISPRGVPAFPDRPAPGSDLFGSLLAGVAGFIDPAGSGQYNAEPLKAAANVANQQYADRLNQFEYAVQNANNAYNDQRTERGAQFDAAQANQQQGNLLRNFDQGRREKFAGLTGDVAGGQKYSEALGPLALRGAQATEGNALDSFLDSYLDRTQRDTQIQNEAMQHNWRNQFDLTNHQFGNEMDLYNAGERSRNNSLDLLGSLLRPQFNPMMDLERQLKQSQIGVNKAREQDILNGGGQGPDGLTDYQRISLALRMGAMGVDPSGVPQVAQIPGMSNVIQQTYQQKATALQYRDPRIRQAENDLKQRIMQRDIMFRDYQAKTAAGMMTDRPSYIAAIQRADKEILSATKNRDKTLEALNTPPRTPGTSTGAPTKQKAPQAGLKPFAPQTIKKAAPKTSSPYGSAVAPKKTAPGKQRLTFDPATGNFR